jgi:hypothetical protein
VTALRVLRMPGHPHGPRPRPAPAPGHPVRVEAQPEGEFSYRGAVAAYRSGYPEDQIHDVAVAL